jgi:hypothetical protein
VQIREALTGKVVGEVSLPVGEKDTPLEPRNLAFSLDGQELVVRHPSIDGVSGIWFPDDPQGRSFQETEFRHDSLQGYTFH